MLRESSGFWRLLPKIGHVNLKPFFRYKSLLACHTALLCLVQIVKPPEVTVDQILGKQFSLDDTRYTVVDVRNIDGETMVYVDLADSRGPAHAAFRYGDIQDKLPTDVA